MRFRLRTLLIVLALGPPGVALCWYLALPWGYDPLALAVMAATAVVFLIAICCTVEAFSRST